MEIGGGRGRAPSRGMLPLLALQAALEYARLDRKPPVTAGLLLANTLIYLRPGRLHYLLPRIEEVWFNPHLIVKNKDLKRFFLSAFYHIGESHLFYNMLSLLWKGTQLEISMGSIEYTSMVAALLGMSQGITLLMAKVLLLFFEYDTAYYMEYSVGFSGVLFAMKVVLNSQSHDYTYVHGLVVPTRYAAWAELVLIQLFVPGVSFLGHLGGIFAGLLYLKLRRSFDGPDPLTALFRSFINAAKWPVRFIVNLFPFRRNRITGHGTIGSNRPQRGTPGIWRCSACTYDNHGYNDVCEMCNTDRNVLHSSRIPTSNDSDALTLEELRRRRLERFAL